MMDSTRDRSFLMDADQVSSAIAGISRKICDEFFNGKTTEIAFVGIQTNGVPLACRIAEMIKKETSYSAPVGTLDISMYRDDIGMRKTLPLIHETMIPFDINGKVIIFADDVIQAGRSIRAALDAITDYGRPGMIRLAVLVDRGTRELPIHADYVGMSAAVPADRRVVVEWAACGLPADSVYSVKK